ncbi:hypothetical protein QL285_059658 [Trifolium repens]|nr:hypothetical protein QL285_059658 [Trifolium repens]
MLVNKGGRTKQLNYSTNHPRLLDVELRHPIIPKSLSLCWFNMVYYSISQYLNEIIIFRQPLILMVLYSLVLYCKSVLRGISWLLLSQSVLRGS